MTSKTTTALELVTIFALRVLVHAQSRIKYHGRLQGSFTYYVAIHIVTLQVHLKIKDCFISNAHVRVLSV